MVESRGKSGHVLTIRPDSGDPATVVCKLLNILSEKDRQLWEKIKSPDNPLHHLLPPTRDRVLRNRCHSFIIPRIRTERFRSIFINRNLLSLR